MLNQMSLRGRILLLVVVAVLGIAVMGALSVAQGRVRIHWTSEPQQGRRSLVLHWQEMDGPPVVAPAHRGYGSRLIERGLRHDLGGDVALDFQPAGVHCRITAPMPDLGVAA